MWSDLWAFLTLQAGYNTNVVLIGVTLLGASAGVVGVFSLLRKRALISDAISHATLPGIAIGFLIGLALTGSGRHLIVLIGGAAVTGAIGVATVHWIRDHTRLAEDTAIGTVLSVFFGLGIVLLSHIQTLEVAGQAGINYMLLGSTAAMTRTEAIVIGLAAAILIAITLLMLKEFALVAFDIEYGQALGWPVARLDLAITLLLLAAVAIGLKTVGMILIIALVIIPPAAARFWTERLGHMVLLSGLFGAVSGYVGTAISALVPDAPAGAVIVLTAGGVFMMSLLCAPARGVLASAARHFVLRLNMAQRAGLLRLDQGDTPTGLERWALLRRGFLDAAGRPTAAGRAAGRAVAKDHGLWAQYIDEAPESALVSISDLARPIAQALPPDALAGLERRARAAGRI